MIESFRNDFKYTKLTEEEMAKRGILGRLVGPIADTRKPTRNGRVYSKELWENVFQSDLMQEKIKNRCLFSELGHPADRTEIDMEKICACMAEAPKVGEDGLLYGVFDILPTNNGKILKTLCDYGTKIGISSRGDGDVITGRDGNEEVDPETYECECWDFVVVPAVESARLSYVTESLDTKKQKTLTESLNEVLHSAKDEDREVMEQTLKELNIDYSSEKTDNKEVTETDEVANDVESRMLEQLQEALQRETDYRLQIKELQEKLSVCNAKETKLTEENQRLKSTVISLSDTAKAVKGLKVRVGELKEEVEKKEKELSVEKSRRTSLTESRNQTTAKNESLRETIEKKEEANSLLREQMGTLQESFDAYKQSSEKEIVSLKESIETLKKNSAIKSKEFNGKVDKANQLVERYQKIAQTAVNKYIESKAVCMGVDPQEIQGKLGKTYSFSDIDRICESLKEYRVNLSKLPFNLNENTRISITESKKEAIKPKVDDADEVDERLRSLCYMD